MSGVTEHGLRGEDGFSLVELSVSVAVLGIMVALAFPSLKGVMPSIRLDNNTMLLAKEISFVRRQAVARSIDFSVVFDADADSYSLRKWDEATGAWQIMGTNRMTGTDIVRNPVSPFGSIAGFSSADMLRVYAGGTVNVPLTVGGAVNFGYITLQTPDGKQKKRIKAEHLGRISVQKWLDGTSWVDS